MAAIGHLLWLKARLQLGSYRRTPWRAFVALVLGTVLLFLSFVGFFLLVVLFRALAHRPEAASGVLNLVLLGIYVSWILLPLVGVRLSDTADPSKLLLFPVSYWQVFIGTTLGGFLDATVLLLLPSLAAIPIGLAQDPLTGAVVAAVVVVFMAHVLGFAEVLQLALWGLLRSRRFRDLAIVAGSLLGMGLWAAQQALVTRMTEGGALRFFLLEEWPGFRFLPPGIASQAILLSLEGRLGAGLAYLGALLGLTVPVMIASGLLLRRIYTGEMTLGRLGAPKKVRAGHRRPNPLLAWVPPEVDALARKELRVYAREPALKARLMQAVGSAVLIPVVLSYQGGLQPLLESPAYLLMAFGAVALLSALALASNQFGTDGEGLSLLFLFACRRRLILMGKNAALFLLLTAAMALLVASSVVLIGVSWVAFPALVTLEACLLIVLGAGNLTSIYLPFRHARKGENPFSSAGPGCLWPLFISLAHLATLVLVAPAVAALLLPIALRAPVLLLLTVPLGVGYSAGVYLALLSLGERQLLAREPDILRSVIREPA